MKLDRSQTVLVVVDAQERLMPVIDRGADVEKNLERLIRGCHIVGVPILVTEQYPKGLGGTVGGIRRTLEETVGYRPIEKSCFSSYGCAAFKSELESLGRTQVVLAGVEAHACVYQTAMDLLRAEFEVTVAADAVSSRTAENKSIALQRLTSEGVQISSAEMVLFELVVNTGTEEFKAISKLIK